jgi:A nuclease family of the HNH/ENDO VII superfamily with conserved AHH
LNTNENRNDFEINHAYTDKNQPRKTELTGEDCPMEYDQSNPSHKKPDYYSYNPENAQPDTLGVHPSEKKEAIVPNLLQPKSPHKKLSPALNGPNLLQRELPQKKLPPPVPHFNPDPNAPKLRDPKPFTIDTRPNDKDTDPNAPKLPGKLRDPKPFTFEKPREQATEPNAPAPEKAQPDQTAAPSPTLIAGAIPIPLQGPLLPNAGEALGTAAKVLLTPLTELGAAGAAAVVSGAAAIVGGEGIFHSVGGEAVERGLESASPSRSKPVATPLSSPAQPQVSAPSPAPISAPISIPATPAKAQFPTPAIDKPSALDIQIQQQQKAHAAQAKREEAEQKKQEVAWNILHSEQSRLSDFSAGYTLSSSDLETFSQGLTPQQRQAVEAQATALNEQFVNTAKQAGIPLSQDEIAQQQQQLVQKALYRNYTPAREIYHFASLFLNGYTPQKMQTVRGYFDDVFAGTYSKAIPAEKRGAIESSADAKYTAETNLKADRESPLWKTLRNIEASEKYPDLWDGFRNDLSAAGQTGVLKTMTNPNDPSLGSNALNRPSQGSTLNVPTHTGHPAGVGQQTQQPVGGGFNNTVNPNLVKPQEGFPTNQPVDGVTHVFEYTTDYRKNYALVHGSIPAGSQIHHIAPRAVFNASPLAQEWVRRGLTKLDYPENLEALPQTQDAYDKSSIKIQHSGSHNNWSEHAREVFREEQDQLIRRYGSLNKVPNDVMEQVKNDVTQQLREDLLDKGLGLQKGWVVPQPTGMDKLSQAESIERIG